MENTPKKTRAYRYKVKPKAPALSEADRVFCVEYVKTNSLPVAVKAAMPHIADDKVEVERWSRNFMARKPIKRECERLKAQVSAMSSFEVKDALDGFLAVWRADPNDLVSVRVGNCRYCNGHRFGYQWTEREYAEAVRDADNARNAMRRGKGAITEEAVFAAYPDPDTTGGFGFMSHMPPHPECPECGGEGEPRVVACDTRSPATQGHPLYAGVKMTKYGPEVMLHDKVKALENVARIIGAYEDRVRVRAEVVNTGVSVDFETNDPNVAAEMYKRVMEAGRG